VTVKYCLNLIEIRLSWWHIPINLASQRCREKDHEYEAV
jgi:hypothetical protein